MTSSGTYADTRVGRLIGTIHQQLNLQETYHNHKERMAWTATSLFLGFTVLFIARVATIDPERIAFLFDKRIGIPDALMIFVLFLIYVLTNVFLWMQFSARWDSAEISHLLTMYLFRLELQAESTTKNLLHMDAMPSKDGIYPDEIMKRLRISRTERKWIRVVAKVPRIFCKSTDERHKSELASYLIALLLFLSQMGTVIWMNFR